MVRDGTLYVVYNENTLGYFQNRTKLPSDYEFMGILGGNKDGLNPLNGVTVVCPNDVRIAVKEDFERFRVSTEGYPF